jgi:hypothetical protein
VLQVVRDLAQPVVQHATQLVVRIGLDLGHERDGLVDELARTTVGGEQPAEEPVLLGEVLELPLQELAVVDHRRTQIGQDDVEHRPVRAAVGDVLEQPAGDGGVGTRPAVAVCQVEQQRRHVVVVHGLQGRGDRHRRLAADPRGHLGCRQLGRERRDEARDSEPLHDVLRGEEVGRDEVAELRAELVLAGRDQCRVRDGQAEGPPEERGHREPVGQPADHPGLGGRAQVTDPRLVRHREGRHEDRGRHREEAPGSHLHPPQVAHPGRVLDAHQHGHPTNARGSAALRVAQVRAAVPVELRA